MATLVGLWLLSITAVSLAALPPSVTAEKGDGGKTMYIFHFKAAGAGNVALAGSFNGWNTTANMMAKGAGDEWTARIALPAGEVQYKFVVDGKDWKPDPQNPESADDNNGGKNSVLKIGSDSAAVVPAGAAVIPAPGAGGTNPAAGAGNPTAGAFQSVSIKPGTAGKSDVTFRYKAGADAKTVNLAGNFNEWSTTANPMKKEGDVWTVTLPLVNEEYQYKFVINGTEWKQDPANSEGTDDGHSGQNSVLHVGPGASIKKSDAKKGDGQIMAAALFHDPDSIDYLNPQQDGSVVVKLRTLAHDVQSAELQNGRPRSHSEGSSVFSMKSEYRDDRFEYYRAKVAVDSLQATRALAGGPSLEYTFKVKDGNNEEMVGRDATVPTTQTLPYPFGRVIKTTDVFSTPDWARNCVWYEIFPERFRNGSKANDTSDTLAWTRDWNHKTPSEEKSFYEGEGSVFARRYGGDLQGAMEKLAYLKSLGVTAIWFNPVFQSESLHKYDAQDYRHIDEHFGTIGDYAKVAAQEDLLDPKTWKWSDSDKLFLEFVQRAHAAGMKVIVDGVFNHTGTAHPAFLDVKQNGQNSRFKDWYNVTSFTPFKYEGWAGFGGLPVFKEDKNGYVDKNLREHIKAVTRRWMDPNGDGNPEDGIDGWRLDVPNEVSSVFWREWRQVVKSTNPNAIIIGEIWDPPAKWLKGDQFDSVMNYQFAKALTRLFINKGKPTDFEHDITKELHDIPDQAMYVMMNLLDSHDTDRIASQLFNLGRDFDGNNRLQDLKPGGYHYKAEKPDAATWSKLKQVVALQFSGVGAPMIYYGDEAGMWGADDPENRKPMIWKDLEPYENATNNFVMQDVFAWYQRCAAIRNSIEALRTGDFEMISADDQRGVVAFKRTSGKQIVFVATNVSGQRQVAAEVAWGGGSAPSFIDLLNDPAVTVRTRPPTDPKPTQIEVGANAHPITGKDGKLPIVLEPGATAILLQQEQK